MTKTSELRVGVGGRVCVGRCVSAYVRARARLLVGTWRMFVRILQHGTNKYGDQSSVRSGK